MTMQVNISRTSGGISDTQHDSSGKQDSYDINVTDGHNFTDEGNNYNYPFHNGLGQEQYSTEQREFLYQGFSFERPIYLYIWEILVIVTCLFNIVVISVLLRKKMRNPTYMILVAISISDSLTGLVTLPTYMDVFKRHVAAVIPDASNSIEIIDYDLDLSNHSLGTEDYDYFRRLNEMSKTVVAVAPDGYFLSKALCDAFMISKFFLSKSFHTVSVWLTLFLGLQRFLSVYSPFQGLTRMFTMNVTIGVCVLMFILAPFLHVYHLFNDKSTVDFLCKWQIEIGGNCGSDCVYLWLVLLLGHLLPAVFLVIFTVMFVYSLAKTTNALQGIGSSRKNSVNSTFMNRQRENRRVSTIVTAIVIVFLIPEVPYCAYLLYNTISAHAILPTSLKVNRAIHAAYEILQVLSFNANFYIYTFFNRRFRKVLKETFVSPVYNAVCSKVSGIRQPRRKSQSSVSSGSRYAVEMTGLNSSKTQNTTGQQSSNEES